MNNKKYTNEEYTTMLLNWIKESGIKKGKVAEHFGIKLSSLSEKFRQHIWTKMQKDFILKKHNEL